MPLNKLCWLNTTLMLGITALSGPVLAEGSSADVNGPSVQSHVHGDRAPDGRSFLPEPLSSDQLEKASGRQGVPMQLQINNNQQDALVSDNALSGNVTTGTNSISGHAFGNMSGIATVIQNTGNQVVIQDSTMINILVNQ